MSTYRNKCGVRRIVQGRLAGDLVWKELGWQKLLRCLLRFRAPHIFRNNLCTLWCRSNLSCEWRQWTAARVTSLSRQEQSRQPVPLIVIITITTNDIIISLQMTALNRIIGAYLCSLSILGFINTLLIILISRAITHHPPLLSLRLWFRQLIKKVLIMFVDNERGSLTATGGKLQLKKSKMIESPTKFYLIKGKNRSQAACAKCA